MAVTTDLAGADKYVLQEAIGAYTDEVYTNARKLSSTGIVGTNPSIDKNTETFMGQMRWFQPLNPQINVVSLTDKTDGKLTDMSSEFLTYIKTVRSAGAHRVNMQRIVTQQDGLKKFARDFGETRAQDEHNAILSVLKGVAISEVLRGAASAGGAAGLGGQTFENDPTDPKFGFYVDLGTNKIVEAATQAKQGAARAEAFINALGMAYKDYEPEYLYLVCSPKTIASLRSANLVDQTTVTDGNITFDTIFNGKFRLIATRAKQSLMETELQKLNGGAGVDLVGKETSFLVRPGALAMEHLMVPDDVAIERKESSYHGGGETSIWYRWGYVLAPAGYSWAGKSDAFPLDKDYMSATEGGTMKELKDVATVDQAKGVWERKTASALTLGILPVFHG